MVCFILFSKNIILDSLCKTIPRNCLTALSYPSTKINNPPFNPLLRTKSNLSIQFNFQAGCCTHSRVIVSREIRFQHYGINRAANLQLCIRLKYMVQPSAGDQAHLGCTQPISRTGRNLPQDRMAWLRNDPLPLPLLASHPSTLHECSKLLVPGLASLIAVSL